MSTHENLLPVPEPPPPRGGAKAADVGAAAPGPVGRLRSWARAPVVAGGRPRGLGVDLAWARWRTIALALAAGLACAGLVAYSFFLRSRGIGQGYWIDEGLSIGIASRPFAEIPSLLRIDGSPPLYYLLLHLWMGVAGNGEAATHGLSLLFALLTIPAALWAGWSLFGLRAGLAGAVVAALNPFLTTYSQETRMYTLLVLLGLLAAACFVHAFVFDRRRYAIPFAVLLAALLYTHNWAFFLAFGAALALVPCLLQSGDRRGLLRTALLAFAGAGLLYLPWVPMLLDQMAHTAAPWSLRSTWRAAQIIPRALIGSNAAIVAVTLVGGAGLVAVLRAGRRRERLGLVALVLLLGGTVASAYMASKVSPAWASRYFSLFLGPLVLIVALGLARTGGLGLAAIAALAILWGVPKAVPQAWSKGNAEQIAQNVRSAMRPGDVVLSTHPEQTPVLRYYLGPRYQYWTPLGRMTDPTVFNWRDVTPRLRRATVRRNLDPLLDRIPLGGHLLLLRPVLGGDNAEDKWSAPWTKLVKAKSERWVTAVVTDGRFDGFDVTSPGSRAGSSMRAVLYTKVRREPQPYVRWPRAPGGT
jgi:hypothetical protein